jgi:hypothetical protein
MVKFCGEGEAATGGEALVVAVVFEFALSAVVHPAKAANASAAQDRIVLFSSLIISSKELSLESGVKSLESDW